MITGRLLHRRTRGVSLIEALVAFGVLAFGMLGVAGMQSTLRFNADIAKQRSEAVRIAQEALEDWRTFSVLNPTAGHTTPYTSIASLVQADVTGYTTNTTYRRTGTVVESAPPGQKTLVVDVEWTDRTGATQNVRLSSLVAGVAPELAATLVSPANGAPTRNPYGRHRGVPPKAVDFGDGKSGFLPPQPLGVTVGWLFDNSTGWFQQCATVVQDNAQLTRADLSCNPNQNYLLLSGFLRYATLATPPDAAAVHDLNALGPDFPRPSLYVQQTAPAALTGPRACYLSRRNGGVFREYFCGVPIEVAAPRWSGSVVFDNVALAADANDFDANRFRICRYFPAASYVNVKDALFNQNYVFIRAGSGAAPAFTCPAGVTWNHQP